MKNLELLGINRPNLYFVASNMFEVRNVNKIIVHGLSQGEGKTTLCAKITYERVKRNFIKTERYIDLYVIPLDQITDYVKNQYEPVKKLCEENYNIIYLCPKKSLYKEFYNLADSYNLTIVNSYKELNKLTKKPKFKDSVIIGASSSQLLYSQKAYALPILTTCVCDLVIDEADTFIGVTTALGYKTICENPKDSFSAKFLHSVVYKVLENTRANINAFTGTPTQEQRGVVVNNEESVFKYFEYESDESTKKPLESITFLNGKNFGGTTDYFEKDWSLAVIKGSIDCAVKDREIQNIKTNTEDGLTMITVGVGMMETLIEQGYKVYNTDMSNVLFYASNSNIKGSILTTRGYKIIAKSLSECKILLEDPNTPYNILVNIRAGTRGFDVPLFDTLFHLAGSAKKLEQYAYSQLLGRINRVCGKKTTRLFLRMREGTMNGLKFYIERTYKEGSYTSRQIFEMMESNDYKSLESLQNLLK
jgi:hypothetical protein